MWLFKLLHVTQYASTKIGKYQTLLNGKQFSRLNGALLLVSYSLDHYHENGPFGYFFSHSSKIQTAKTQEDKKGKGWSWYETNERREHVVNTVVFCKDLATLGPYYHDLGPIFPSTALALS